MLEDDNELRASKFHCLIAKKYNVQIPAPTVQRFLKLKLNCVTVRTGSMTSDTNKIKRVEFAKHCGAAKDPFKDVIKT